MGSPIEHHSFCNTIAGKHDRQMPCRKESNDQNKTLAAADETPAAVTTKQALL